eukprot:Gb_28774 [translate_table: standard]
MDSEFQYSTQDKMGLVKKLGSCDKNTRDKAVALLKVWLTTQKEVGEEELKKIWKSLFYCIWNADKQPFQGILIEKLSSIIETLDLNLARQYFQVFLFTMRREWSVIDHISLEKFYLLLRRILHHMFLVLNGSCWNSELVSGFMSDMIQRTFLAVDRHPAQAMNLHLADVYLNELHGFFPIQLETFVLLIEPFYSVLAKASDRRLLNRVKGSVFDCLLENGRNLLKSKQEGKDVDEKVENLGSIALTMGVTNRFFQLATFPSTLQSNRRVLYELHEEFRRLNKSLTASGVLITSQSTKKPKIYDNEYPDKSLEEKSLAIQELLVDSGSGGQIQQIDNMQRKENCNKHVVNESGKNRRLPKAKIVGNDSEGRSTRKSKGEGANIFAESSATKSKAKVSFDLYKSLSQCKEVQDVADEVIVNHVGSHWDGMDLVNVGERLDLVGRSLGDSTMLDVSVVANLENQFEKVAAELDDCMSPILPLVAPVSPLNSGSKKRKRVKSAENELTRSSSPGNCQDNEGSVGSDFFSGIESPGKSVQKRVKKVRFSLKNNLVWKPYNPLPPENLRVPPSAAPRGSALKKGVPPGPICIIKKSPKKKVAPRKQSTNVQKTAKNPKSSSISPMVLRKRRSATR